MSKTKEEILIFLLQNSVYYEGYNPTVKEKKEQYREDNIFNKKYWYRHDMTVPYLMCELSKFEEFLGEKFSFSRHLKPLADLNLIHVDNYNYPEEIAGQVKNYKTGVSYVIFHPGPHNPNAIKLKIHPWV